MQVQDGKGSGKKLGINDDNQALIFGVSESELAQAARKGDAFSIRSTTWDYSAADTVLLVANEKSDRDFVIDKIMMGGDTATVVQIHSPAYPTLAGTVLTPVNLNRKSNKRSDLSAYRDETGNTQANVLMEVQIAAATQYDIDVDGAIVLGEHDCIAVDFATDGAAAYCTIVGHFRDVE